MPDALLSTNNTSSVCARYCNILAKRMEQYTNIGECWQIHQVGKSCGSHPHKQCLKHLDNIGKTEKQKCSQIYT